MNPRLKVFVSVGGVALEEHVDEDDEQKPEAVTKYIEAVSGAEFTVDVELQKPWPDYSVLIDYHLDGKWMRGTFIRQEDFVGTCAKRSAAGIPHSVDKDWYIRNFCFSDLVIGKVVVADYQRS